MVENEIALNNQRDRLQSILLEKVPGLLVNADINSRLAGNLHISIPDIPNSAVIARVRSKLAISTAAACSSGIEAPSHVLQALGLPSEVIEGALRIGIGKFTTESDINQVFKRGSRGEGRTYCLCKSQSTVAALCVELSCLIKSSKKGSAIYANK